MSRIIPLTGPEAARTTQSAQVNDGELHTTSDQLRLFLKNAIVAPYWHGAVADQTAMLRLANRHSGTGVSAAASDNSINDAGGFPGDWTAGDVLTVDGFATAANNGVALTIVSRTTNKIVLSGGTLVNESAGATVTVTRNGKPGCWPGDKCRRTDYGTIWECVSNNGKLIGDWIEVTTDRIGLIRMWSGSLSDLPSGHALCDGTGGTPDLRDKFILGKGASSSIGDTGGSVNHHHGVSGLSVGNASAGTPSGSISSVSAGTPAGTIDAHSTDAETVAVGATTVLTGPGTHTFTGTAMGGHSHTFTGSAMGNHSHSLSGSNTDDADGRPPFYVLAFIKRVS